MMNVAVSGVFEQPNELANYNNCEGLPCFDWDTQYPMSSHLIDPLIQVVVNELTLASKAYQDRTNSGASEMETQLSSKIPGSTVTNNTQSAGSS